MTGQRPTTLETPRKHHYVPAFYLKQWAGTDGQVCEYRRVRPGKITTKRVSPGGTGYRKDLYRVDADPDVISPEIESTFMRLVDMQANRALQQMITAPLNRAISLEGEMRSAWTRFILSLRFRNPESVNLIKRQMTDLWKTILEKMRADYDVVRYEGDPPTFEEFLARTEREAPQKAALNLLQQIIDNDRVGPTINDMGWFLVSLNESRFSLLTSDRPLDMPHGLGAWDAHIALPIGPAKLFVAARDDFYKKHIVHIGPTKITRDVNAAVVYQAREFVWGVDGSHDVFVGNRMAKGPDQPVITDHQRQQAIDAAWTVGSGRDTKRPT